MGGRTIVVAILTGSLCLTLARAADEDANSALKKCEQAKFHFAAVIEACSEAIRLDPENPFAWRRRGDAYLYDDLARDYDRAIADYDVAIRLDPKSWWAYTARSYAWSRKGDHVRAAQDAEEARRLKP